MTDFGDALTIEAAKQIVSILTGGLVEAVKKVPDLWRRAGSRKQELIEAEVQRSALALQDAGDDLPAVLARQEGAWEGRLRDLLAEHPEAAAQLRDLLDDLQGQAAQWPQASQYITASAPGAIAQGAMYGNVNNYPPPPAAPVTPPDMDTPEEAKPGQP